MSDHGGEAARQGDDRSRLRLTDVAEMAEGAGAAPAGPGAEASRRQEEPPPPERPGQAPEQPAPYPPPAAGPDPEPDVSLASAGVAARKRAFAELLGEFRRTTVLVPLGEGPGADGERGFLTADFHGVRFILAFSDEQALARYALARGEYTREWAYQSVLGARLLDVAVPAAGVACGVALDCADGEGGMVFPPVRGIVPDAAAVDGDDDGRGDDAGDRE